ncbi:hypothetical protein MVEN_00080800 [Mycena venus]|uniref:ATP synthase F0 subunit 8 n=1 Tax=Mycena venus TaxID=2733690 RepID=A0A8H6Z7V3_9AGAR|nr:hypothetical protein MVEN_00080800 [Mycena venus]
MQIFLWLLHSFTVWLFKWFLALKPSELCPWLSSNQVSENRHLPSGQVLGNYCWWSTITVGLGNLSNSTFGRQ